MLAVKIFCFSDFKVSFLLFHNISLTISQLIKLITEEVPCSLGIISSRRRSSFFAQCFTYSNNVYIKIY